jgi:hypothetical protein
MALIDEDYLRISLRTEEFRISFEEPFRVVFGLAVIGAVSGFLLQGVSNYVVLGLFVPLVTGGMSAAGIEILRRRYKFQIGPEGISCYNFWGLKRTIPWGGIEAVRPFRMFGLEYLRIEATGLRSDIWLPMFVDHEPVLTDLIFAHVNDPHPLATCLARRAG